MKFGKVESKKGIGIFENKNIKENFELLECAANYWIYQIQNAGSRQINFEMGKGHISVSDKNLEKFRKIFVHYVSKLIAKEGSITLWTSDGENFNTIGTDSYLREIMKEANLPLTSLPSDMFMWITSSQIAVEDNFKQSVIYGKK